MIDRVDTTRVFVAALEGHVDAQLLHWTTPRRQLTP
jgi:hypothetical protein